MVTSTFFEIYFDAIFNCAFKDVSSDTFFEKLNIGSLYTSPRAYSQDNNHQGINHTFSGLFYVIDSVAHSKVALQYMIICMCNTYGLISLTIRITKTYISGQAVTTH